MEIKENSLLNMNRLKSQIKRLYGSSSKIIDQLFYGFHYDQFEKILELDYFDDIKNDEYPFLLDITMVYDDYEEKLLGIGFNYEEDTDQIVVRLLSNSFHDDDLVEGVLLSTSYEMGKGLVVNHIIEY